MSRYTSVVLVSVILLIVGLGPVGAQFLPEIGNTASMVGRAGAGVAITNEHATGMMNPAALPMLFRMPTKEHATGMMNPAALPMLFRMPTKEHSQPAAQIVGVQSDELDGHIVLANAGGLDASLLDLRSTVRSPWGVTLADIGTPQVAIEARFITIDQSFLRDIGVDWRGLGVGVLGYSQDTVGHQDTKSIQGAYGTIGSGSGLALGWIKEFDDTFVYAAYGRMLRSSVLGAPRLTAGVKVSHNSLECGPDKLTIDIGAMIVGERPFIDLDVVPSAGLVLRDGLGSYDSRLDGGVALTGENWRVALDAINIGDKPGPEERHLRVGLQVESGRAVVLGGLTSRGEATVGVGARVPWLNKIPLVGGLFSRGDDHNDRSELLVVVTPRIVQDTE